MIAEEQEKKCACVYTRFFSKPASNLGFSADEQIDLEHICCCIFEENCTCHLVIYRHLPMKKVDLEHIIDVSHKRLKICCCLLLIYTYSRMICFNPVPKTQEISSMLPPLLSGTARKKV